MATCASAAESSSYSQSPHGPLSRRCRQAELERWPAYTRRAGGARKHVRTTSATRVPAQRVAHRRSGASSSLTATTGLLGERRTSAHRGVCLLRRLGLERLPRGMLQAGSLGARLLLGQSVFGRLVSGPSLPRPHCDDDHRRFSPDLRFSVNDPISTIRTHTFGGVLSLLLIVRDLDVVLRVIDVEFAASRFSEKTGGIPPVFQGYAPGLPLRQFAELVDQLLLDRAREIGNVSLFDSGIEPDLISVRHGFSSIRSSSRYRVLQRALPRCSVQAHRRPGRWPADG